MLLNLIKVGRLFGDKLVLRFVVGFVRKLNSSSPSVIQSSHEQIQAVFLVIALLEKGSVCWIETSILEFGCAI